MTTEPQSEPRSEAQEPAPPRPPQRGRAYARLSFTHPARGKAYRDILRQTTLLGSASDSAIRLLSTEISPAHCVITVDNEVSRVRALHRDARIRVNGYPVEVSVLSHGDRLEIGPFSFVVE